MIPQDQGNRLPKTFKRYQAQVPLRAWAQVINVWFLARELTDGTILERSLRPF